MLYTLIKMSCIAKTLFFSSSKCCIISKDLCSAAESHPQRPGQRSQFTDFKFLLWLTENKAERRWSKSDTRLHDAI